MLQQVTLQFYQFQLALQQGGIRLFEVLPEIHRSYRFALVVVFHVQESENCSLCPHRLEASYYQSTVDHSKGLGARLHYDE